MQSPQQEGASWSDRARQAALGAARPANARAALTAPTAAQAPAPPAAEPAPQPRAARAGSDACTAGEPRAEHWAVAQAARVAGSAGAAPAPAQRGSRHAGAAPADGTPPRADEADRHAPADAAALGEPEGGRGAQPPGLQLVVSKVEAQAQSQNPHEPAPQDGAARPGWQRYVPAAPPAQAHVWLACEPWPQDGAARPGWPRYPLAAPPAQAQAGLASEPALQDVVARPGGWPRYPLAAPSAQAQAGLASEPALQDVVARPGGWQRYPLAAALAQAQAGLASEPALQDGVGRPGSWQRYPLAAPLQEAGHGRWRHPSSASRPAHEMDTQDSSLGHGSWPRERSARDPARGELALLPPQHAAAARSAWPPEAVRSAPAGHPEEAAAGRGAWAGGAGAAAAPDQAAGAPGRRPIPLAVPGGERGWRDGHGAAASQAGMRVDVPAWSGGGPPQRPSGSSDGARAAPGGQPGSRDEGLRSMHVAPQAPPPLGLQGRAAPAQSMYWGGGLQSGSAPAAAGAPWPEGSCEQLGWAAAKPAMPQREEAGARASMSAEAPRSWAPRSAGRPQPPGFPPHPPHPAGTKPVPILAS